jgi:hypothetical protein
MNRNKIVDIVRGKSARDNQVEVGPSEIGGCRRKVWHRLQQTPTINHDTLRMAAWMGTSIHKAIEAEIIKTDPFEDKYLLEVEVHRDGLMGHVDCYDIAEKQVVDWKTTTKKNLSSFPSDQQRMQVQLYAWMLNGSGFETTSVQLVGIPRDGNELDIVTHVEDYDEDMALEGISWLREVKDQLFPPDPEKPVRFCRDYCNFYDQTGILGCPGK